MRKFNIKVNGINYEVEVEEVTETAKAPQVTQAPAPGPELQKPVVKKRAPAAAGDGEAAATAPIPGTVLDIRAAEGDRVESGQVILILEAMKMENEICAPAAGVISSIPVAKGDSVAAGDILATVKED